MACDGKAFDEHVDWIGCGDKNTIGNTSLCSRCLKRKMEFCRKEIERLVKEAELFQRQLEKYTEILDDYQFPMLRAIKKEHGVE